MESNNEKFPTDVSQLRSHFDPPVDDALLQRWHVAPASIMVNVNMGGDTIITQKDLVDDVFDQRFCIGPHGVGSRDFLSDATGATLQPVREAFKASNGQWADKNSKLLPYATTPEQQLALQKLIMRDSVSK